MTKGLTEEQKLAILGRLFPICTPLWHTNKAIVGTIYGKKSAMGKRLVKCSKEIQVTTKFCKLLINASFDLALFMYKDR